MENLDFQNKKVIVRVDFNVPLSEEGEILDDTRIRRALPTIKYILNKGGSVILMSHLGRPLSDLKDNGTIDYRKYSLNNIVDHLSDLLSIRVQLSHDCGGADSQRKASHLKSGEVLLLENTRFYREEKEGNLEFSKSLAQLADIYINDAFGTAHRAHASTTTIARFFTKKKKGFGFLMQSELENAEIVLRSPKHPFVAIIGGAKVSDKIELIENLLDQCDDICIGGGMAYTFHNALGYDIGKSLCESDKINLALEILEKAKKKNCNIHLPVDSIVADEFSELSTPVLLEGCNIPDNKMGLGIGPRTISLFSEVIAKSKTIIWNGPMGVFEFKAFSNGTFSIAKSVAKATDSGAYSLIGGGDSVSAIKKTGLDDEVSFISTGGGAMLELLEGKTLPGVAAILETQGD
jgi:phosphoglycerate kinase